MKLTQQLLGGSGAVVNAQIEFVHDGDPSRRDASDVLDVAFESVAGVRTRASWKHKRNYEDLYWAATIESHVWFESLYERAVVMRLDRDRDVVGIAAQPMWIHWALGGKHAPDYFVRYRDGRGVLIDVKPDRNIRDDDVSTFALTADLCAQLGWEYMVVSAISVEEHRNLRFLSGYRYRRWAFGPVRSRLGERVGEKHSLAEWAGFVDEILDQPVPMRREELEALSAGDRALNRESRKQFMIRGSVVHTAPFRAIETEILRRLMLNRYKSHGKLGVIVSGETNIGKTTTITQIARRFGRRSRGIGAVGSNAIPVIYVSVSPSCTPKLMLGEFAHFLGLPERARYNTGELMNTIATLIGTCGTELIVVDEIHNLNQRYRQMAEASDTLKQLSEKCPGAFVYAGVNVEASGLLDGTRGRQISSRFQIMNLQKFPRTGKAKQAWANLLVAVEGSLGLLGQEPGAILRHERELHDATAGIIGGLTSTLHMLAIDAIDSGAEHLDLDAVFGTKPAPAAAASAWAARRAFR